MDSNVFYRNTRDVMTEVTHGPITFMNNVFASEFSFDDYAQGAAFVNNLFAGRIRHTAVLDRSTPYHFPHVTDVAGEAFVYGGDDRTSTTCSWLWTIPPNRCVPRMRRCGRYGGSWNRVL